MMASVKNSRLQALQFVADWIRPTDGAAEISTLVDDAEIVAKFIEGAGVVVITVRVGLVRKQATGAPSPTQPGGSTMQLHDDEQVSYTLAGKDAKGFDVEGEAFSAASSDDAVAPVSQNADGSFEVVAGVPGSAVITFTATLDGEDRSVTEAIDVIAGGLETITVTPGAVEPQPAAPTP
jgi:hypothetical protein